MKNIDGKNLLVILGSPRKNGNSTILARELIKGAEAGGAKVAVFRLQEMNISPCDGCGACQRRAYSGCIVNDDMQTLYPRLKETDAIVIASPIYWFAVSAQTKAFIDRLYALQGAPGNALKGKQVGIILTYADTDPTTSGATNAVKMFQDIFDYFDGKISGVLYGSAWRAGEIKGNQELLKEAYELGKKLSAAG